MLDEIWKSEYVPGFGVLTFFVRARVSHRGCLGLEGFGRFGKGVYCCSRGGFRFFMIWLFSQECLFLGSYAETRLQVGILWQFGGMSRWLISDW